MFGIADDRHRFQQVCALAEAGDIAGAANELLEIATTPDRWSVAAHIIEGLSEPHRTRVVVEIANRARVSADADQQGACHTLAHVVTMQALIEWSPDAAEALLNLAAEHMRFYSADILAKLVSALAGAGKPLSDKVIALMRRTAASYDWDGSLKRLTDTIGEPLLNPGEAWADRVLADLPALTEMWRALLVHAGAATSARPSARWERRGRELLAAIGESDAGRILREWLVLVGRPRTVRLVPLSGEFDVNEAFDVFNATALRGLIWTTAFLPDHPDTVRVLGGIVETALRKVAGIGPRSPKVANAAVYALSRMNTDAALGQIARLAARVTVKGTAKELNAALDARAAALNLTRDEIEELAVPMYGLTDVGCRVDDFGEARAEIDVVRGATSITWRTGAGKVVKSPPAAVRTGYADELKELKAAAKDIDKMLSAQSDRLDRQFLTQRVLPYGAWRERYLDHPLLGTIARRIIWLVDGQPACFAAGALQHLDGSVVEAADDEPVRLWHPIDRDVDEVMGWRRWLEQHEITQPFKQAHREVYRLTAAEEATRVYSNRYAAHVLRQHQFNALAAVRGWNNRLRLMVDDTYPPASRELRQWQLRAEFWIEGAGDDATDTTESGTYLRITTDQVRFYPVTAPENLAHAGGGDYEQWVRDPADVAEAVPLATIPPLVFSEIMRDVDLFVGVASVGNDPTWQDGGPGGRFREYWASYSFGELSATAETRRELLERLIPRLAIADRAAIEGRFLIVRGDLRTYKIHLGSGNILMSPNDEYLCIVAKQSTDVTGGLFLPFEGDRTLALILSKAILLAKDTQITDRSITQQIGRRR